MASLRARVLACVLLLAAAGLIALAAVTYAEQSSFLHGRVDQEVRAAGPAVSQLLDSKGLIPDDRNSPAGTEKTGGGLAGALGAHRGFGEEPHGGPANLNLPPGTYAQRREASGKVLGSEVISFGQAKPPAPKIPAKVPVDKLFTVGSVGSSGLQYRAIVFRDPEDSGLTLAAVPLGDVNQTLNRLLLVEGLVIVGVLVALGLSAFFVVKIGLRPLDRIEVTAGEIAAGNLSRRVSPATPRTEVGRLGIALNGMLDRLEQAFAERQASEERLRRFLADASHELRTPLASIRGYAELFRMGATKDAAGTEMAMRRIEEESKRMGVLVEDLLTLARLDEAPVLTRQQVDLSALARDAVDDARATSPQRSIELQADGPAIICGEEHQLRQVLANLMRNALVHTPAQTAIEVALQGDAATVRISVRDHGPGLPPGAQEALFNRFWRSEAGRGRGKAGAGLGLAIAREIVQSHGGEITASNAENGGAVFTICLPVDAPQASGERQEHPAEQP
jgi:two-component system, OmpR family, sensor kinase